MRGAPDRRSPHFSTIATSHGFFPKPVAILLPQALPPSFGSKSVAPPPNYPMPPTPSSPLPPFIPTRALWTLPVTLPVNRTSISVLRPPPTLVQSFTVPPCPFRPSSIPQTSVGPGLLIPSAFYTPPALNYPRPHPLYLTHKTPPTLIHWWFSTWGAHPRHPTDRSRGAQPRHPTDRSPLSHQPINLHLPTPQPNTLCTLTSTPDMRTHGIVI